MLTPLLSDVELARRLERAEAHANMAFVVSRARFSPDVGATWCDFNGTWAMFDGVQSPLTQTFGLGCFVEPQVEQLVAIEEFFEDRGADSYHEVSTIADLSLLSMLGDRGYRAIEWSAVLCQRIVDVPRSSVDRALTVRRITADEHARWADVSARGWAESAELADFVRTFAAIGAAAEDTHAFIVEADGEAIATGSLHLHDGVALMAGASTVPAARGRGAQRALFQARLAFAEQQGADVAMIVALPGSISQRNAQRSGFVVAYSRVKWHRPRAR